MKILFTIFLMSTLVFGEKIERFLYSPEKEAEMLAACGQKEKVSFSEALRELLPGIAEHYFDEKYFQKIAKLEEEKFDGEYIDKWENGQMRTKVTFKNGIPDGHFHGWYPNGGEAFKGYLDEGKKRGIHISFFYEDPVYYTSSPIGRLLYYNEKGQLHGNLESCYPRGRLKAFVQYYNGEKDGKLLLYNSEYDLYFEKYYKVGKEAPPPKKG